ncbi:MAG: glycosyltransferase [Lachnospiraceae bacterium]|nr:glycosyltransferase [Lachnospiraceae bacterium]
MKIAGNSFEQFHSIAGKKKIIAFGASDFLRLISLNYKDLKLDKYIHCVADNNTDKQGGSIVVNGCEKLIIPPEKLLEYEEKDIAILITSDVYAYEIYAQLEEMLGSRDVDVFVLSLMISKHIDDVTSPGLLSTSFNKERKIPKIIHYFWFSKEPKEGLVAECIESWKRACPDYELREWNADNYDVAANPFAYEAFKQRKWAYASDYARLDVVHKYGGIYLDLDVILHKSLDVLLSNEFFVGFGPIRDVEAAIFGAVQGSPLVKEMMQIYSGRVFEPNVSMTLLNLQPVLLDRFFENKGFEINGKYQEKDGAVIYPRDLFSAKNWFTGEHEITEIALGIHECAGGWTSKNGKSSKQIKAEGNRKLEQIYESGK